MATVVPTLRPASFVDGRVDGGVFDSLHAINEMTASMPAAAINVGRPNHLGEDVVGRKENVLDMMPAL
jgi:hypothetical protein